MPRHMYRFINQYGNIIKMTENPKDVVKYPLTKAIEKIRITEKGIETLWYHTK